MNKAGGWSLLEVLVAVAVIVIAFIPLVNMVSSNAVTTVKVGNYAKASGLLTKFLEEVKHVRFTRYQQNYEQLQGGEAVAVPVEFYPDTLASIEELKKDKEFWIEATMKASKNDFDQLVEIAFKAEIFWRERGTRNDTSEPQRSLRDFALIFNPEARF
jgi:type II secretory pathway pseudopilin PulG